jgi:hypothetical protein
MALTMDEVRRFDYAADPDRHLPLAANAVVYEGAALGNNGSGYARPLVAGDPFMGFAYRAATGTSVAGAVYCEARSKGQVLISVVGVTGVGNHDAYVYASDDGTFTLTEGSNSLIGVIVQFVSGTLCMVRFTAEAMRSPVIHPEA